MCKSWPKKLVLPITLEFSIDIVKITKLVTDYINKNGIKKEDLKTFLKNLLDTRIDQNKYPLRMILQSESSVLEKAILEMIEKA